METQAAALKVQREKVKAELKAAKEAHAQADDELADAKASKAASSGANKDDKDSDSLMIIIVIVVCLVLLIVAVAVAFVVLRKKPPSVQTKNMTSFENPMYSGTDQASAAYSMSNAQGQPNAQYATVAEGADNTYATVPEAGANTSSGYMDVGPQGNNNTGTSGYMDVAGNTGTSGYMDVAGHGAAAMDDDDFEDV